MNSKVHTDGLECNSNNYINRIDIIFCNERDINEHVEDEVNWNLVNIGMVLIIFAIRVAYIATIKDIEGNNNEGNGGMVIIAMVMITC